MSQVIMIGGVLPSVEEYDLQSDGSSTSSYTFSGVTLTKDGLVVVRFLVGGTFNATRTAASVTVGGNPAPILEQGDSGIVVLNSAVAGIAAVALNAGASGNIVIAISGGLNAACMAIHPLCIRNLRSITPHDSDSAGVGAATSISASMDIPSSGVQVVSAASLNGGAAHTATGFSNVGDDAIDSSWRFHRGWNERMAAESARTLTSAGTVSTRRAIAAASWR